MTTGSCLFTSGWYYEPTIMYTTMSSVMYPSSGVYYTTVANYVWCQWNVAQSQWNDQQERVDQVAVNAALAQEAALACKARDKAKAILVSVLDVFQRAMYEDRKSFEVLTTSSGKLRRYLVEEGKAGNIYRIDERGEKIERYCIHPAIDVPVADVMLSQKLLLEADEKTFLRTANRSVKSSNGMWVHAERAA